MTTVQVTVYFKVMFIFVNSTSVCSNYGLSINTQKCNHPSPNSLSTDVDHDTDIPQCNTSVFIAVKYTKKFQCHVWLRVPSQNDPLLKVSCTTESINNGL